MKLKTKPCRDCRHPVIWWATPAGAWQLYEPVGIPYMPGVPGIAASPTRGWVDAGTAWPEPADMLPRHRCTARELVDALAPVGDVYAAWLEEWGPMVYPGTPTQPERKRA